MLNDEQKGYIAKLQPGHVVMYSSDWANPLLVKIKKPPKQIGRLTPQKAAQKYQLCNQYAYCPETELADVQLTEENFALYHRLTQRTWWQLFNKFDEF